MFCGKCGNEIPEGGSFCVKCGTKTENAVQQVPAAEKPKKSKKPIIIAAVSAVAVIGIISAIATPSILRKEKDDISTPNNYGDYEENPATTVAIEDFELSVEEPEVTTVITETMTDSIDTTTTPPATTTAAPITAGDVSIIGNRVGNIANGGLITHNGEYWIADNYHSIYHFNDEGKPEKFLYTDGDGAFSNLLMDGDNLYFIYDKQIYLYKISADTYDVIPELEKYSGDDMRLYLSNDYYFVYTEDNGFLRRISRSTGKEEQIAVIDSVNEFIFWDSCLYYIKNISGEERLWCVSSSDFYDVKEILKCDGEFNTIVAGDNYIYVVRREDDGAYIDKYAQELTERVDCYDITDMCQESVGEGKGYYIPWLNVIDNQIFVNVNDNVDFWPGLFHIIDNGDTFTYKEIASVGWGIWGSFVIRGTDYYEVNYLDDDGTMYFNRYDLDGNEV